jgi:hypothetical protein
VFEGSLGLCEESVKPLWNKGTWREHAIEPNLTKTIILIHIRITSFPLGLEV